ncbi:Uncharacterised protein [Vibrio cholerae]|nr:Uncharacterised protein [Vibrio cholerae]
MGVTAGIPTSRAHRSFAENAGNGRSVGAFASSLPSTRFLALKTAPQSSCHDTAHIGSTPLHCD